MRRGRSSRNRRVWGGWGGQGSAIKGFSGLEDKRVCAEQDSAPYKFLMKQTRTPLRVVEGIANNADMFWRYGQAANKGTFMLYILCVCMYMYI